MSGSKSLDSVLIQPKYNALVSEKNNDLVQLSDGLCVLSYHEDSERDTPYFTAEIAEDGFEPTKYEIVPVNKDEQGVYQDLEMTVSEDGMVIADNIPFTELDDKFRSGIAQSIQEMLAETSQIELAPSATQKPELNPSIADEATSYLLELGHREAIEGGSLQKVVGAAQEELNHKQGGYVDMVAASRNRGNEREV